MIEFLITNSIIELCIQERERVGEREREKLLKGRDLRGEEQNSECVGFLDFLLFNFPYIFYGSLKEGRAYGISTIGCLLHIL